MCGSIGTPPLHPPPPHTNSAPRPRCPQFSLPGMNNESQGSRQSEFFTTSLFCFHLKAESLRHFRRDNVVSQHHLVERDSQIRIRKDFKFVYLRLPSRDTHTHTHTKEGRKGSWEGGREKKEGEIPKERKGEEGQRRGREWGLRICIWGENILTLFSLVLLPLGPLLACA